MLFRPRQLAPQSRSDDMICRTSDDREIGIMDVSLPSTGRPDCPRFFLMGDHNSNIRGSAAKSLWLSQAARAVNVGFVAMEGMAIPGSRLTPRCCLLNPVGHLYSQHLRRICACSVFLHRLCRLLYYVTSLSGNFMKIDIPYQNGCRHTEPFGVCMECKPTELLDAF